MQRPERALTHPLWWGALMMMILNDHALKGSAVLPGTLTGKISDFAGLLVAPMLLATCLKLSTRRSLAMAHIGVGLIFALINLSSHAAGIFTEITQVTPWPWVIYVDPTDLIALPMLGLSWHVFMSVVTRPISVGPMTKVAASLLGAAACLASSL